MTNLLPQEEKNEVVRFYRSRIMVFAGTVLIVSAGVCVSSFIPGVIVLRYAQQATAHARSEASKNTLPADEAQAIATTGTLFGTVSNAAHAPVASEIIQKMLTYKPERVSVTHIIVAKHDLIVSGVSSSSEATNFTNVLRTDPAFKQTTAPQNTLSGSVQTFTFTIPQIL